MTSDGLGKICKGKGVCRGGLGLLTIPVSSYGRYRFAENVYGSSDCSSTTKSLCNLPRTAIVPYKKGRMTITTCRAEVTPETMQGRKGFV